MFPQEILNKHRGKLSQLNFGDPFGNVTFTGFHNGVVCRLDCRAFVRLLVELFRVEKLQQFKPFQADENLLCLMDEEVDGVMDTMIHKSLFYIGSKDVIASEKYPFYNKGQWVMKLSDTDQYVGFGQSGMLVLTLEEWKTNLSESLRKEMMEHPVYRFLEKDSDMYPSVLYMFIKTLEMAIVQSMKSQNTGMSLSEQ